MTYLGISHLAFRKSNGLARGVYTSMRVLFEQSIIKGRVSLVDRITLPPRIDPPSI